MSLKTKLRRIFIAWDFFAAIISAALYAFFLTTPALPEVIKEITVLAVSTLSIIFSVFFAALAVLITSGDNEFVKFLQKFGAYSEIIWSYKFTLLVIFCALLLSIILYVTALFEIAKPTPGVYPLLIMIPYVFLTTYALFCTVSAAIDAIKYAEYRTKFLAVGTKENDKKGNSKGEGK